MKTLHAALMHAGKYIFSKNIQNSGILHGKNDTKFPCNMENFQKSSTQYFDKTFYF